MAASDQSTGAVRGTGDDATVVCWRIVYGVLGDPPDLASDMRSVRGAVSIAAGSNHNCARFADGGMRCWGANGVYQLGVSGSLVLSTPVAPNCQVN